VAGVGKHFEQLDAPQREAGAREGLSVARQRGGVTRNVDHAPNLGSCDASYSTRGACARRIENYGPCRAGQIESIGVAFDDSRVNPNGGAIAVGHPLGASGTRLALTAARQLQRTGGRYALVSMCIGVGQGIAVILERV